MDKNQLPHMLKLLDDESTKVKSKIYQELVAYGPNLKSDLDGIIHADIPDGVRPILEEIYEVQRGNILKQQWVQCMRIKDEMAKLEEGLSKLAHYQFGEDYPIKLKEILDQLADEYTASGKFADFLTLSRFLFQVKGFKGNTEDYFNPLNSNLIYVIQEKKGIPISLVCVFILVGYRLKLKIDGCNLPGHFLARANDGHRDLIFDCFHGGKLLSLEEIENIERSLSIQFRDLIQSPPNAQQILTRFLHNLVTAYQKNGESKKSEIARDLLDLMGG